MSTGAAPNHPDPGLSGSPGNGLPGSPPAADLDLQLPADAYWQLIRTLRLTLPPPLGEKPEDLLRRDHAAIARIAALVPANAAEAELAAQFVAASEQSKDCLRLAQRPETTPEWGHKCRAQALAMMRQANAALRLLLRLQAAREKRDADQVTRDRAAWTEHCATRLMAEALTSAEPAPGRDTAVAQSSAPSAASTPAPNLAPAEQAEPGRIAQRDAIVCPERAAPIRDAERPQNPRQLVAGAPLPEDAPEPPGDDLVAAGRDGAVAETRAA